MATNPQVQFTDKAQEALLAGQTLTQERRLAQFEPEALLVGLVDQADGVVPQVLLKLGIDPAAVRRETEALLDRAARLQYAAEAVGLISRMRNVLQKAQDAARQFGDEYVSTEHLLLGVIETPDSEAAKLLRRLGAAREAVFRALQEVRGGQRVTDPNPEGKYQALEKYGRDLTELAREGKLDPVIGRDEEIRGLAQVLCRMRRRNAILVGEPGVGKTAIVEGLAQRIVRGDVPEGVKDKKVVALDPSALVAGMAHPDGIEERLRRDLALAESEIVLFLDAFGFRSRRLVKGVGAIVADGRAQAIVAVTPGAYRDRLEQNALFRRLFDRVQVEALSADTTVAVLRALRGQLEEHHGVKIVDSALAAAAHLVDRHVPDRRLPGGAIDAVDEAAARLQMERASPLALDQVGQKIVRLEAERESVRDEAGDASRARLAQLERELAEQAAERDELRRRWREARASTRRLAELRAEVDRTQAEIEQAQRAYDWTRAAELQYGTLRELEAKLAEAERGEDPATMAAPTVEVRDVVAVVNQWSGAAVRWP